MTRFRCVSDRGQHLLPDQATEWSDPHPVRAKLSSCRDICAQYSSLGPQLCGVVSPVPTWKFHTVVAVPEGAGVHGIEPD